MRLLTLASICLLWASVAWGAGPVPIPGEILVAFTEQAAAGIHAKSGGPATGLAAVDVVLARNEVTSVESVFGDLVNSFADPATRKDLARHYLIRHASKAGDAALIAALEALPEVAEATPNLRLPQYGTAFNPNDLADAQWYARNLTLGGKDTRALGAWAEAQGDSNVVIAVLDSGIDYRHPDLGGSGPNFARGAIWMNWREYNGTPGVDDDGNGLIDDIRGWDYVNEFAVYPGEDPGPPDNDPMDFGGHGTNCAGCISPITNNGIGIAAMAPGCKMMAVRIGWLSSDGNGYSNANYMAQGFVYATAKGAKIINLSYGTGYTPAFQSAIAAALNAGVLVCVAAGNDNQDAPGFLQGYPDDRVLTVAATNSGDGRSDFSNYGAWIDVCAPGQEIYTTSYQGGNTHGYVSTQGTSFASPITAGGCALIWSAHPGYTAAQVATLIQNTCDNIDSLNPGYEGELGAGRINLLRALGDNVHQVPGEFTALADAMNQASPGDMIKVLATYPMSNTSMLGKGLQILGGYAPGYVTRDPLNTPTVIAATPTNPGLQFVGAADTTCVVDGFRVQGGGGRFFSNIPYSGTYGGGILLNQVSPKLRNIQVTGNSVGSASAGGFGGGIAINNAQPILENVRITDNSANYGAGVFVYRGAPIFRNCELSDNHLIAGNGTFPPNGGGLHLLDATATLNGCTVSNHVNADEGGGIFAGTFSTASTLIMNNGTVSGNTARVRGAGIAKTGGSLTMTGVTVADNTKLATSSFMAGGGIQATNATVSLGGLTVSGNQAQVGGGVNIAGCPGATLTGCLLAHNDAAFWGGAALIDASTGISATNLTVVDNTATAGAAGLHLSSSTGAVGATISAFNTGGAGFANGLSVQGSTIAVTCSDVFGNSGANYGGMADPTGTAGNISADPMFCDRPLGNYGIAATSPAAPPQSPCGLMGARPAGCGTTPVEDLPAGAPMAFRVDPNFPNPFNPSTSIRFALPAAGHTVVTIYDVAGRLVKTLLDGDLPAAEHTVRWIGDDDSGRHVSAGVYFYRVESGDHSHVGRMALVK